MTNGVKSWSYSAYALYDQCPQKYKYVKIDKMKEPQSEALERGNRIHKLGERFLLDQTKTVPVEYRHFASMLEQLKELEPFVEQEWGFDKSWRESGYRDWNKTWFRAKLDAGVIYPDKTAEAVDFKTGKLYKTNEDQVELFGAVMMTRYPQVTHVTTRLWYLDSGDEIIREYTAADRPKIIKKWEQKVGPLFADQKWAPKPGPLCKWCHFRKDNGGPCRF